MKAKERAEARELRKQGHSIREIALKIQCAKSSVSEWVRDIPLTTEQIERLKSNQDKGRAKAANHPNSSKFRWAKIRQQIIDRAKKEVPKNCSLNNLKLIGTSLYWAEGYMASRHSFVFANSDAGMIKLMMRFLIRVCKLPLSRLRGRVNIHPHLDIRAAEKYWSKISGIPLKQFHVPLLAVSRASKQKRKTLPHGTFRIVISDVALCSKIKGWIEGMKQWAISSVG